MMSSMFLAITSVSAGVSAIACGVSAISTPASKAYFKVFSMNVSLGFFAPATAGDAAI
jgi:hypothetical protein